MTRRQAAMVESYAGKQSLRLVAIEFGVSKPTVHKAIVRAGKAGILRRPWATFKWERPKRRNRA